jgi:hypothetical protein
MEAFRTGKRGKASATAATTKARGRQADAMQVGVAALDALAEALGASQINLEHRVGVRAGVDARQHVLRDEAPHPREGFALFVGAVEVGLSQLARRSGRGSGFASRCFAGGGLGRGLVVLMLRDVGRQVFLGDAPVNARARDFGQVHAQIGRDVPGQGRAALAEKVGALALDVGRVVGSVNDRPQNQSRCGTQRRGRQSRSNGTGHS